MPSQRVSIVLDVQGFKDHTRFIFKDVAYIAFTDAHVIDTFAARIASPKPFKNVLCLKTRRSVLWVTRFHHGIHWDDPGIPYKEMVTLLRKNYDYPDTVIYVKGEEKKIWVHRIFKYAVIQDLGFYGCPSLKQLKKKKNMLNCAYENVKLLFNWKIK